MKLHFKNTMCYVYIQALRAKIFDTVDCVELAVRLTDNMFDQAVLYWEIRDIEHVVHLSGNSTISGTAYNTWGGDKDYVFNFVANQKNLTIIIAEEEVTALELEAEEIENAKINNG